MTAFELKLVNGRLATSADFTLVAAIQGRMTDQS